MEETNVQKAEENIKYHFSVENRNVSFVFFFRFTMTSVKTDIRGGIGREGAPKTTIVRPG